MSKDWNKCVEIVFGILSRLVFQTLTKEERESSTRHFYVFGGYVRDMLVGKSGEEICDLDLRIESRQVVDKFLEMTKMCGMVRSSARNLDGYGLLKMVLVLPGSDAEYSLDINYPHEDADQTKMLCDFTCNNLCLDKDGTIWTRFYPGKSVGSRQTWTATCIRDATKKTLRWTVPKFYSTDITITKHMEQRLTKMSGKGFHFPQDGSALSVTGFEITTQGITPDEEDQDQVWENLMPSRVRGEKNLLRSRR